MAFFNKNTATSPRFNDLLTEGSRRYLFAATGDEAPAQIDLFGDIDDWWGFGVRQMAYDLAGAGSRDVVLRIHSPGGLVTEGLGIRNLIKAHPGEVTTRGVGFVASIASVILLAGDRVEMDQDSFLMIHRPWAGMFGADADELRKQADLLDKMEGQLADIYVEAIKARKGEADRDQVLEWMNSETWFTASEALDAGFIDAVAEVKDFAFAEADTGDMVEAVDQFNHTPAALRASLKQKISNKMSESKKGLLDQIRALFVEAEAEVETPEAQTEENPATPEVDIDAARAALEAAGYVITEAQAEEATTEPEGEAIEEDEETEVELLASLRDEIAQLRAQVKRKAGTPSGGSNSEGGKAPKRDKVREKAYTGFASTLLDYARQNS